MLVKVYWTMWIVGIVFVGAFYATGNLTPIAAVAFGFMSFALVFMGMMSVLPATIGHPKPAKNEPTSMPRVKARISHAREWSTRFKQSWMSANSVEVRRPRYR